MTQLWPGGPLYDGEGAFPVTTDSVLLADFARVKSSDAVYEPCCGAGLISVLLHARAGSARFFAVELDSAAAAAAGRSFAANGLAARVVCGDALDKAAQPPPESCTLAVCNPPYFAAGSGRAAPDETRARQRSEAALDFASLALAAARALRQGGRFAFVHRTERLASLFEALRAARLEPKRLRLVQHRPDSAPSLALCEAVKLAAPGLRAEPALILYDAGGAESAEFRRIYRMEV